MSPGAQMTGGPQRMKANWKVVETKCLTCFGPFTFGDEVCLCTLCGGYHHAGCWDSSGGCTHPAGLAAAGRAATVIEGAGAIPPPLPPTAPMTYAPPPPVGYGAPPPPPVGYGTPPPPPAQPQALAPDEQYCPRCGNIVKTNALSCRFCNNSFSYPQPPLYPGQQPYGNMFGGPGYPPTGNAYAQAEAEKKASSARTCGMISLITILTTNVISFFAVASQSEEFLRIFISIRPLFGLIGIGVLVLAIVAVVKGSGAKRLMDQFPVDPRVRSKATAGQVMGWITLGIALLGIIMVASGGMKNFS